jgi:hypothetical protein
VFVTGLPDNMKCPANRSAALQKAARRRAGDK